MSTSIGSHTSIENGIIEGANIVKQNGGNIFQIYSPNKKHNIKDKLKIKDFIKKNNMICVIHAQYTINLANEWTKYDYWILNLISELNFADDIGAKYVVVHFGKSKDLAKEIAYNNMFSSLIHILKETRDTNVMLLLETTAGQGTELCYKIEELSHFYKKFSRHRDNKIRKKIGICVDTCHIFAAGYNITTKNQVTNYIENFNELIGLQHIKLIHLNDSAVDVGTRVDRHQSLGMGKIGINGLVAFAKFFKKRYVPILLETPKLYHKNEIKLLNKL